MEKRKIRSFVLRQGRMTDGQKKAMDRLWPRYGLELDQGILDFAKVFANDNPVYIEIGFGMGDSLSQMAQKYPKRNFIGIEVHQPGVGHLMRSAESENIDNLRIFKEDALEVLKCIADHSLAGVYLLFPDPWHKKRHHKRRIVQEEFVNLIHKKLQSKGFFHIATDWAGYAEHIMEIMVGSDEFSNKFGQGKFASKTKTDRMDTKFEKRGENLGHQVFDMVFLA